MKFWLVFVENTREQLGDIIAGREVYRPVDKDAITIIYDERLIVPAAKQMSAKYPGLDVHVCEPKEAYYTPLGEPSLKVWNGQELVPTK